MANIDEIYKEYFFDVYKYLLAMCKDSALAEEITQETFFKTLQSIDKFKGECSVYAWLCQIAKNTYFSHLKKQKHINCNLDLNHIIHNDISLDESIEQQEAVFEIHKALHDLEEPYKEVFHLRIFGELSYSQIAQLFNKTESWARVTYHRAKLKLKERML